MSRAVTWSKRKTQSASASATAVSAPPPPTAAAGRADSQARASATSPDHPLRSRMQWLHGQLIRGLGGQLAKYFDVMCDGFVPVCAAV